MTMLQRSPTYIVPSARARPAGRTLRGAARRGAPTARALAQRAAHDPRIPALPRAPGLMRALFRRLARAELPAGYDVDTHFSPTYNPWDQRVCMAADGDLFDVLRTGSASIVTAAIDCFTETGVRLVGGEELAADIIVTATGLRLLMLGGIELDIDGEPVELGAHIAYKGMMLCGVPNMALALGYTNASWTLKADLVAEYVCRLLRHMQADGRLDLHSSRASSRDGHVSDARPEVRLRDCAPPTSCPKQGAQPPWRLHQNYIRDIRMLRHGPIDDEMELSSPVPDEQRAALAAAV